MEWSLAARNSMDEYTDEEIIINIDDFRADSMQFNELLILLDPYHSAPKCQLDIEISSSSIV